MKLLWLQIIVFLFSIHNAEAQNISWFYGTWYGETYFPNGPITKRIIVRMNVTKVRGNTFTATMANLYPNDTTIRLERELTGKIIKRKLIVTHSEETYIRDPRTRNFWQDCSSCPTISDFSITNSDVVIKITTTNCSDICNGETIFKRDTSHFDLSSKIELAKWFVLPAKNTITKVDKKKNDSLIITERKPILKDSVITNSNAKKQVVNQPGKPVKKDTTKEFFAKRLLVVKDTSAAVLQTKKDTIPEALTDRKTNLVNTYQVTSPHIIIQLFDNAEIDGDMVSVFHNGQRIVERQTLTHKAITYSIDASAKNKHHEFVMVAENLGLTPPNTALMRITAGNQKFELEISSDFNNNAEIAIDYTGE